MCYCIPMAVTRAGSTVIGNAVGARNAARAATAARLCLVIGLLTTAARVGLLTLLRGPIVGAIGSPPAVSAIVRTMIPLVAGFLFCDCMQMNLSGIIIGAGKQTVTGPVLVVAYWVIGLPFGALPPSTRRGHPRLGLLGLWLGMTVAVSIHFLSFLLLSFGGRMCGRFGIRWDVAVAEAQVRLQEDSSSKTVRASASVTAAQIDGLEPLPAVPMPPSVPS